MERKKQKKQSPTRTPRDGSRRTGYVDRSRTRTKPPTSSPSQNKQEHSSKKTPAHPHILTGIIHINARGTGYLAHENFTQDIEIPNENLNTALNRDTVDVVLLPRTNKKERVRGEVQHVIKRAHMRFVGVIQKEEGVCSVSPDDKKMYRDILLSPADADRTDTGDKVLIELLPWDNPNKAPIGKLITVLGKSGTHDVEMQAIVLAKGFDIDFPPEVIEETKRVQNALWPISDKDISERRDMRSVPTFTIDPDDAKDFDDALSVKKKSEGMFEIGIHIADVSHYVREGSALDQEAQKRGFSVYLVDRTIPMLPLELSTDICSLNPSEDRLAFSSVFTIDAHGTVHDEWFGKTVIHSDKRFSYEDAQHTIENEGEKHHSDLIILRDVARAIRAEKFKAGAIDFETDEVEFILADDGTPKEIYIKERLETHKLIEEFMLLANRKVAEYMYRVHNPKQNKHDKHPRNGADEQTPANPFIYRVHDLPDPDKLESLSLFLKALGYEDVYFHRKDINSKDINAMLRKIDGTPEEAFIKTATIRSMAKAAYSTKNVGHFGLAFDYYTHFTSPIRRYADLLVHRLLFKHLSGEHTNPKDVAKYQKLALEISENEIAAAEAERDSIKYKQVEYMTQHIGETLDATVSGVAEYGLYVRDKLTHAEGLLHISQLGKDYYQYDEKTYALVGERTKKRFMLGDDIKVKLTGADIEKRQLDFELADEVTKNVS